MPNAHSDIKHIACLTASRLHHHGMEEAMRVMAPHSTVTFINPQHLYRLALKNYDVLILPGSSGENSHYPDFLSRHRMKHILEAVEHNGLSLVTFCAATYYLFDHLRFIKRDGTIKEMDGLGVIHGHADGPAFKHETRSGYANYSSAFQLHDLKLATLEWTETGKAFHAIDINGPALHLDDRNLLTKTFLRYANVPETPAAGFLRRLGKGQIIGLSVHPEISMLHETFPDELVQFEQSRLALLKELGHLIFHPSLHLGRQHHQEEHHNPQRRIVCP